MTNKIKTQKISTTNTFKDEPAKMQRAANRNNEKYILKLLEQTPETIMVCDSIGIVLYVTNAAHHLPGDIVRGQSIDSFLPNIRSLDKPIKFADIKNESIISGAVVSYHSNDDNFDFLFRYTKVAQDSIVKGYVITLTDITELKRTNRINHKFIELVSHELKTPLTVTMGAVYTAMIEGITAEERQELLRDAASGAEELEILLENLLEFSRFQNNRLELNPEIINITNIIHDVVEKLRSRSSIHELAIEIPEKLPPVSADGIRIRRILCNLVENAIKYSPSGGQIRIFARIEKSSMLIGVNDRGMGISLDQVNKIFQPFIRLESEQAKIKGLGLGLSVCRKLVEAHRGRLWLESEPGKGSTFFFTLPLDNKSINNH